MDKAEIESIKWTYRDIFMPIIRRSIANMALIDSLKVITENRKHLSKFQSIQEAAYSYLTSNDGKRKYLKKIKKRRKMREDIISEMNIQYGLKLEKDDAVTSVHLQEMGKNIDLMFDVIENLIKQGKYAYINELSKE